MRQLVRFWKWWCEPDKTPFKPCEYCGGDRNNLQRCRYSKVRPDYTATGADPPCLLS